MIESIEDLKPAPYNPRKIDKKSAAGLSKSIEDFGDISGIVWNKRTGHVVSGHQRLEQLKGLGGQLVGEEIRVKVLDETKSFPVRVVDWTVSKEKAANIVANNPSIGGEFTDVLGDLLGEIKLSLGDDDFAGLRLDDLATDLKIDVGGGGEVEEDEVPEPPANPVTKLGDVWTLGDHTVVCGDATAIKFESECVFTDPPYGVSYQSRVDEKRRKNWGGIEGDDLRGGDLVGMLRNTIPEAEFRYVCCPWETLPEFREALGQPRSVCVWDKGHFGLGKGYRRQFELIMFYGKLNRTDLSDVWGFSRAKDYQHPTQKPVGLPAKALEDCGAKTVQDPFLGSGTTLIAAEQLNRKCYGTELEPKYVDVIVERWENLTGGKATRKTS